MALERSVEARASFLGSPSLLCFSDRGWHALVRGKGPMLGKHTEETCVL